MINLTTCIDKNTNVYWHVEGSPKGCLDDQYPNYISALRVCLEFALRHKDIVFIDGEQANDLWPQKDSYLDKYHPGGKNKLDKKYN